MLPFCHGVNMRMSSYNKLISESLLVNIICYLSSSDYTYCRAPWHEAANLPECVLGWRVWPQLPSYFSNVWLVYKHLSCLGMQLKYRVHKIVCAYVSLSLSAAVKLAVSLSQCQNGKNCDTSEEELRDRSETEANAEHINAATTL